MNSHPESQPVLPTNLEVKSSSSLNPLPASTSFRRGRAEAPSEGGRGEGEETAGERPFREISAGHDGALISRRAALKTTLAAAGAAAFGGNAVAAEAPGKPDTR